MLSIKSKQLISLVAILLVISITMVCLGRGDATFEMPDISHVESQSIRHTHPDNHAVVENRFTTEGYELKLENDILEVWFNSSSDGIIILDKRSGYIWGGSEPVEDNGLNKTWTNFADSICSIEVYNKTTTASKLSLSDPGVKTKYQWKKDSVTCEFKSVKLGISFSFEMALEDDSLVFSVVEGSLEEKKESRIKSLYFMPFLGSTVADSVDGYMFIPDGCGALIRYAPSSSYVSAFEGRVFGKDAGIDVLAEANDVNANRNNEYLIESEQITMPVYGIVHGVRQNGLFFVIEDGYEFASITASVAGIVTDYNWVSARFDYRRTHTHPTSGSGNGVYQPQTEVNKMTPKLRVYFTTGEDADYSSMANLYRNILKENGTLGEERKDSDIPLRLDVIGADIKDGFLYNSVSALTTVEQVSDMYTVLSKDGVKNITLVYEGWQDGGLNGAKYGDFSLEGKLGSLSKLKELSKKINSDGGKFYLAINPLNANESQINPKKEAAISLSKAFEGKMYSAGSMFKNNYFVKTSKVTDFMNTALDKLDGFDIAFRSLGDALNSDYADDAEYTRTKLISMYKKSAAAFKGNTAFYDPNIYFVAQTDDYFDIPIVCSQYLYETDTVPFLQMVLKGSVDYYAPYSNQGFYSQNSILKMVEYAMYPSFLSIYAENSALENTMLSDYFSLNFNDWKANMKDTYEYINGFLSQVEGEQIVDHTAVSEGLVRVTYSSGTKIYVNYGTTDAVTDSVTVPAQDCLLVS